MTWLQELAQAQRTLRDGGHSDKTGELTRRVYAARSPEEAHAIIGEYVYLGPPADEERSIEALCEDVLARPMRFPRPPTPIDSDRRPAR